MPFQRARYIDVSSLDVTWRDAISGAMRVTGSKARSSTEVSLAFAAVVDRVVVRLGTMPVYDRSCRQNRARRLKPECRFGFAWNSHTTDLSL